MVLGNGEAADGKGSSKTRIFISYSRKDLSFTDRIESGLKGRGFDTSIDRSEIYALEDWWKRIETLIAQADTIVFVLSPDAVASDVCQREVAFAASLNKRLAPVVHRRVDDKTVPDALARLNFIFFDDEAHFEQSLNQLAEALETDVHWIRRHTEFGEHARRWAAAGRPGPRGLLLRSPALEEAERWIASRPEGAPAPTEAAQTFIAESRRAATQRRNILSGSLGAGLLAALVLAGLAYWQRGVAIEQRGIAVAQQEIAAEQRDKALTAQSRLLLDNAKSKLKTGSNTPAVLLTLAALPRQVRQPDRPFLSEAVAALYEALSGMKERSLFSGSFPRAVSWPASRYVSWSDSEGDEVASDVTIREFPNGALVAKLSEPRRPVGALASPAGSTFALQSDEGITLFRAADGRLMHKIATQKADGPPSFLFSPDGDLVVGGSPITIWDVVSGNLKRKLPFKSSGLLAISPNGKFLAISEETKTRIVRMDTFRQVIAPGFTTLVSVLKFSPDSSALLTGSYEGKIGLWDTVTGKQLGALTGLQGGTESLSFSADGRYLLSETKNITVGLWDVTTRDLVEEFDGSAAAFFPDSRYFYYRARNAPDGEVGLVVAEVRRGKKLYTMASEADEEKVIGLEPQGRRLWTWSKEGTLRQWMPWSTPVRTTVGASHTLALTAATVSNSGRYLATASKDRTARLWDSVTGEMLGTYAGHSNWVNDVDISRDDRLLITASEDRSAIVWEIAGQRELLRLAGHEDAVVKSVFTADATFAITASQDRKVRIWNVVDGSLVHSTICDLHTLVTFRMYSAYACKGLNELTILSAEGEIRTISVTAAATGAVIAFDPSRPRLATLSEGSNVSVWDLGTGSLSMTFKVPPREYKGMEFNSDAKRIVAWTADAATVWDIESGTMVANLSGAGTIRFTLDAKQIIKVGEDLAVYDAATGQQVFKLPFDQRGRAIKFSADGRTLLMHDESLAEAFHSFTDPQQLIDFAIATVPRCLTTSEIGTFHLEDTLPDWCSSKLVKSKP